MGAWRDAWDTGRMSGLTPIRYPSTMTDLSQVLIIDDHPLFREALSAAVSLAYPTARSKKSAMWMRPFRCWSPIANFDIALLDLNIPGVHGFEGLLRLRTLHPRLPVLVVSGLENEQIIDEAITYVLQGFFPNHLVVRCWRQRWMLSWQGMSICQRVWHRGATP